MNYFLTIVVGTINERWKSSDLSKVLSGIVYTYYIVPNGWYGDNSASVKC